jgi:Dynein heavy chain, N-terminal region 1
LSEAIGNFCDFGLVNLVNDDALSLIIRLDEIFSDFLSSSEIALKALKDNGDPRFSNPSSSQSFFLPQAIVDFWNERKMCLFIMMSSFEGIRVSSTTKNRFPVSANLSKEFDLLNSMHQKYIGLFYEANDYLDFFKSLRPSLGSVGSVVALCDDSMFYLQMHDYVSSTFKSMLLAYPASRFLQQRRYLCEFIQSFSNEILYMTMSFIREDICKSKFLHIDASASRERIEICNRVLLAFFVSISEFSNSISDRYRLDLGTLSNETRSFTLFSRRIAKIHELSSYFFHIEETLHSRITLPSEFLEIFKQVKSKILLFCTNHEAKFDDYATSSFDKDYIELKVAIQNKETEIQVLVQNSFRNITKVISSVELFRIFHRALSYSMSFQDILKVQLYALFSHFGDELISKKDHFESLKRDPPKIRDLTPIANKITWSRDLLSQAMLPMQHFLEYP